MNRQAGLLSTLSISLKELLFRGSSFLRHWFVVVFMLATPLGAGAQDTTADSSGEEESSTNPSYRFLLKEVTTSINSKGLKTTRLHNQIKILKHHAIDEIGDVSIPYNAFRSGAHVVKAFTRTADGRVVELRKESVRDLTPDEVSSYQMYTDVHQLTFSMPALGKDAIMDYEVEIEEKKPVMPGNFWVSEYLDAGVQVCTSRVTVTFPAKRDVKILTTNLSANATFTDTTKRGERMLRWEMKDIPILQGEEGMPPYATVRAQVHLTSVKSWQEVQDWYAALAEKQLQSDDETAARARAISAGMTSELDQIQALYRYASHDVRYVGVELGRSAYEPHPPRQTMQSKYGDCKDKAALLTSLLRSIGFKAYLAIVRPNYEGPLNSNLPGPSQFSHAIVYIARDQGDLWIDATQPFGEVTEHGYHLDDVDALVIGLAGKNLVHIPALDETHSVHRLVFDADVHYGGLATVHEKQEYSGRAAIAERESRSRLDADKVRKQLEKNFAADGGYARLLNYAFTNPTNDMEPMRIVVDYDSDTFLTVTKNGLSIRFDAASLRDWLDVPRRDTESMRERKRRYPWVTRMAHTEEINCRLHLAPGYELTHLPTAVQKELPHGKIEVLFDKSTEAPSLTIRVIRRPARLEPGELPEVARQVDVAFTRARASLDIQDSVNKLMREHRYAKAEATVVDAARQNTNSVDALVRLGTYYRSVGRIFQARQAGERAIGLSPADPRGYELLSDAFSGVWGTLGEGYDLDAILGIYHRALTNVPSRGWAIQKMADACLFDVHGRNDSTNRLGEAENYFRQLTNDNDQNFGGLFGLGAVNRLRGNYDEAESYYRRAARVKPDKVEPKAGIWLAMAYAGRDEEAYNAMSAYYGSSQELAVELARVAVLLMTSRHYAEAANLYARIVGSAARPDAVQTYVRLIRKMEKVKRDDYADYYDDTSPEGLARTFAVACVMADTNRVVRCLAPAVNREETLREVRKPGATGVFDINYLLDAMFASIEIKKRSFGNGDVEIKIEQPNSAATESNPFGNSMTIQAQQVGNRWRALTINTPAIDFATIGNLALEALDRGDTTNALSYRTRIADMANNPAMRSAMVLGEHLRELAFTNENLRVKAWAGLALVMARNRSAILRGAACLDEVSASYPQDALVKMANAFAHMQTANVKKAADILDTIDIAKLASPPQLGQLAGMMLDLEKFDAAEKTIARLREVSSEDEQSLAIQAHSLTWRGRYPEAAAVIAKLRERSKRGKWFALRSEGTLYVASHDEAALRDLIERWREPEQPIASDRAGICNACLSLGLNSEGFEQVATMLAEGAVNSGALLRYAEAAIANGNTTEARDFLARAARIASPSDDSQTFRSRCISHLILGDYAEAAGLYHEMGTRITSDYSGYFLCFSALASRLAGDTATAAQTLKEALTMQGDGDWPRLAIHYINGEITEAAFRQAPERTTLTPLKRASRECEINCIIGLYEESRRNPRAAFAAYQASLATKSLGDVEYFISKAAIQRLQASDKLDVPQDSGAAAK